MSSKVSTFLENRDTLGQSVAMRFNGNRSIDTSLGGFCSLFYKFWILVYIVNAVSEAFITPNVIENTGFESPPLEEDSGPYNFKLNFVTDASQNLNLNVKFSQLDAGFRAEMGVSTKINNVTLDYLRQPERYIRGYWVKSTYDASGLNQLDYFESEKCNLYKNSMTNSTTQELVSAGQEQIKVTLDEIDITKEDWTITSIENDDYQLATDARTMRVSDLQKYHCMPESAKEAGIETHKHLNLVIATCEQWQQKLPLRLRKKVTDCANAEETEAFLEQNDVMMRVNTRGYARGRFNDKSSEENKIAKFTDDFRYSLDTRTNNYLHVEVVKKITEVNLNSVYNGAFSSGKEYEFAKIQNTVGQVSSRNINDARPSRFSMVYVQFGLAPQIEYQKFSTNSAVMMLCTFGGYVGIIDIALIMILGFFQDRQFDDKLIQRLYSARPPTDDQPLVQENEKKKQIETEISSREKVGGQKYGAWCSWWTHQHGCCCKKKRNNKTFADAEEKLMSELDVVEIIKTLRIMKFMMTQQTTRAQRELVKFFDYYTVKSGDEAGSESEEEIAVNEGSMIIHKDGRRATRLNNTLGKDQEQGYQSFWAKLLKDFDPENNAQDKEILVRLGVDQEANQLPDGSLDQLPFMRTKKTTPSRNSRMQVISTSVDTFMRYSKDDDDAASQNTASFSFNQKLPAPDENQGKQKQYSNTIGESFAKEEGGDLGASLLDNQS